MLSEKGTRGEKEYVLQLKCNNRGSLAKKREDLTDKI